MELLQRVPVGSMPQGCDCSLTVVDGRENEPSDFEGLGEHADRHQEDMDLVRTKKAGRGRKFLVKIVPLGGCDESQCQTFVATHVTLHLMKFCFTFGASQRADLCAGSIYRIRRDEKISLGARAQISRSV